MSLIWSRKHSCKTLRFVNIFDCFDMVQTALVQRVEIFKRVWFVKYGICGPELEGSMSIILLLYKMTGLEI